MLPEIKSTRFKSTWEAEMTKPELQALFPQGSFWAVGARVSPLCSIPGRANFARRQTEYLGNHRERGRGFLAFCCLCEGSETGGAYA